MIENSYNDLIELQEYMKNKYNIDVKINKIKKTTYLNKTINQVYKKIFIVFILIIILGLLLYFLLSNKKFSIFIQKYSIVNVVFNLIIISTILILIYFLQKYLFMIYFYYKNHNKYEDESIDINNINFNTGDILQESSNWNYNYGLLLYFSKMNFFHNLFIIKFNNKNYVLHFTRANPGYPENFLNIGKHIEIFRLEDYLKDNYRSSKYYRVFKYTKNLDNDNIFNFLKIMDTKKLNFSWIPCIKDCDDSNYYNCMSFILKILNKLNIIPKFNISIFTSEDLSYLEHLSNNSYNKPFIIKI